MTNTSLNCVTKNVIQLIVLESQTTGLCCAEILADVVKTMLISRSAEKHHVSGPDFVERCEKEMNNALMSGELKDD